ncbi:MAG: sensor signal transduction histidine kinase [Acidobacteriales bacterium]|nr:sensor signal transduction histidine kinase [Terriglobales bacterium]
MRLKSLELVKGGGNILKEADSRIPATLRLLHAERSDEIFPILMEEIVKLGYPRAFVLSVNFETGEVSPIAGIKCSDSYLQKFRTSLYADHPIVSIFHGLKPSILPRSSSTGRALYCHPIIYRNPNQCWEAERQRRPECMATDNFRNARKLSLEGQQCKTCEMRSYAAAIVVEFPKKASERAVGELGTLIELANKYLARLFKIEHYYNRMRDMEDTISQMNAVMMSMADPVVLTDMHFRVVMQNQAAAKFFKLPDETTEGLIRAIELNNMLFSAALSSMAISGTETHRDLTLVDPNEGEELLFEAVCVPSFTREGLPSGLVTVMRDVTDLRRADQELQANYEKLRAAEDVVRQDRDRLNLIIENVGDPIIVCDSDGKVVLVDPLAEALFGSDTDRDPTRVTNQAVLDAYVSNFTYSFSDTVTQALNFTDPSTLQVTEFDARSGKIYDERGQVAYTVTVLRDWSPIRKLEQLKVERRMLEIEKFASAGRLAATIAHEVNNPMEAIKNAIYLLAGKVKPEAEPVYGILKSETERVARIVRQMLGLYRNQESVKPVNVNTLAEDTLLLLARQLQRSNVEVVQEFAELPPAVVSSDQMRQVFSNIVINAKDSMPNGGRLKIRTRQIRSSDGLHGWIRVLIADTGSGIPKDILDSVFEPFVTTKGEKGTGLGLWIVKGIIGNHGGKISVRSKVGFGTVFKIDLPMVRL